ncbi:FtsX-like permease family protein [Lactobacillus sp. LC28-10]|uniref:FtsX-like permease family protein n=1 Tax=Secundilactobacillus angelensis TaxID=2722706 RepID=A0ABX1KWW6_9LACO|nr:FtsX-like permease family protein [Secundilactobacillus angelensis]MCH5462086.1 FtsX-like permease family protein [Secundilactobacillus angelensis]NLR18433.1 FtsX-like permease family protein [Secundilactobacillus angelensis]
MLNKLAFAGVKSRLKDYVVLFFGLIMSSAIFYMFESLATNKAFIKANAQQITGANFIFLFGAILLTIITLVYVFYANSFLMSMRRHDYGLFMMLGAKQSKIGQLILVETMAIGTIASVIGTIIGWGFTASVGPFLMSRMIGNKLQHFNAFYVPAIVTTIVLYLILFLIAGIINRLALTKTSVLQLLKGDSQPNRPVLKPVSQLLQVVVGVLLLMLGYYAMSHVEKFALSTIPIGLVTIVLGTYFLFNAIFVWLILLLKRSGWASLGLRNFTLSQLSFRLHNYTKILSVVSILIALSLGAITVGIGMQKQVTALSTASEAYTMAIKNPSRHTNHLIDKLTLDTKVTYQQKETSKIIYYRADQFKDRPLEFTGFQSPLNSKQKNRLASPTYQNLTSTQLTQHPEKLMALQPNAPQKPFRLVSRTTFNKLPVHAQRLTLFRVKNLQADKTDLKHIVTSMGNPAVDTVPGAYGTFVLATAMFGGLEFMGFFLGIAFLAMLASCLMFKILSGAATDKRRYEMLNKIGARPSRLRASIAREILVLFVLPAIVGVVHVLFGLLMFKVLMLNPYYQIWLPFTIFFVLYMIYYIITVRLYEHIVLPKLRIDN